MQKKKQGNESSSRTGTGWQLAGTAGLDGPAEPSDSREYQVLSSRSTTNSKSQPHIYRHDEQSRETLTGSRLESY